MVWEQEKGTQTYCGQRREPINQREDLPGPGAGGFNGTWFKVAAALHRPANFHREIQQQIIFPTIFWAAENIDSIVLVLC